MATESAGKGAGQGVGDQEESKEGEECEWFDWVLGPEDHLLCVTGWGWCLISGSHSLPGSAVLLLPFPMSVSLVCRVSWFDLTPGPGSGAKFHNWVGGEGRGGRHCNLLKSTSIAGRSSEYMSFQVQHAIAPAASRPRAGSRVGPISKPAMRARLPAGLSHQGPVTWQVVKTSRPLFRRKASEQLQQLVPW